MLYYYKWKDNCDCDLKGKFKSITGTIVYGETRFWNNYHGYVPAKGTIVVYVDYHIEERGDDIYYYPAIKIGNGNAYVQDLAFINQKENEELIAHLSDGIIHITPEEREKWNNKLNVTDGIGREVVSETLILHRH